MSEQPPQPSGQLPRHDAESPHQYDPDPEAPPGAAGPSAGATAREGAGAPRTAAGAAGAGGSGEAAGHDREEQIRGAASQRLDQAADAARRLGHRAREQGGVAGRAEPVAYRVGDSLQSAASYVREHDVGDMRQELEGRVRQSPIRSLALAAAAGFVIGRLIR